MRARRLLRVYIGSLIVFNSLVLAALGGAQDGGAGPAPPKAPAPAVKESAIPQPPQPAAKPETSAPPSQQERGAESKSQATGEVKPTEKEHEKGPQPEEPGKPATKQPVRSLILSTKLALMADPQLFLYEIEVEANGEEVTLSGRVANEPDRALGAAMAQRVPGVKTVVNKLQVDRELERVLARKRDDHITHYVKERFAKSKTLQAVGFDVRTEDGVVFLSGKTRFQVFVLEAAEDVRSVPGVKAVRTDEVRLEAGN